MDSLMYFNPTNSQPDLFAKIIKEVLGGKKEKLTAESAQKLMDEADFGLDIRYDVDSKQDVAIFIPKSGIKLPQALPVKKILKKADSLYEIRDCVPIDSRLFPIIREFVDRLQQSRSQTFTHKKIGFTAFATSQAFLYEKAIGPEKMQKYDFYYSGKLDLRSEGSSEEMLHFVREHAVGNRCFEIALSSAFAGVITQALDLDWTLNLTLYLDNYGIQRALSRFMLGTICNPQNTVQSFTGFSDRKDSNEIQRLQELTVIPCCVTGQEVEESELEPIGKNLAHLVHSVLRDKQNAGDFMNSDNDRRYFSPLTFFLPDQLSGAFVTELRKEEYFNLLELHFEDDGKIQSCSRELDRLLRGNRAVLMEPFVQYLFDSENLGETLLNRYDDIVSRLTAIESDSSCWCSLCDRMALLLLTQELVSEAFDLHLDTPATEKFLINQARDQIENCRTCKFYEDILRKFVDEHEAQFVARNELFETHLGLGEECFGILRDLSDGGMEITVPTNLVGKIFSVSDVSKSDRSLSDESRKKADKHFLDCALKSLDQAGIIQHKHARTEDRFCYRKLGYGETHDTPCYIFCLQ